MNPIEEQWADFLTPLLLRFEERYGWIDDPTIDAICRLATRQQLGPTGPITRPGAEEMEQACSAFPGADAKAVRAFFHDRCPE